MLPPADRTPRLSAAAGPMRGVGSNNGGAVGSRNIATAIGRPVIHHDELDVARGAASYRLETCGQRRGGVSNGNDDRQRHDVDWY